jgi:hypothetical protein
MRIVNQLTLFHPEAYESYDVVSVIEEAMGTVEDGCQSNHFFFDGEFRWQRNLRAEWSWDLKFSVLIPRVNGTVTHRVSSALTLSFLSFKQRAESQSWSRSELIKRVQIVIVTIAEDTCFELTKNFKKSES